MSDMTDERIWQAVVDAVSTVIASCTPTATDAERSVAGVMIGGSAADLVVDVLATIRSAPTSPRCGAQLDLTSDEQSAVLVAHAALVKMAAQLRSAGEPDSIVNDCTRISEVMLAIHARSLG